MEAHTFLIQLVLILFSARIVGETAAYFNVPSVVGELIAGILIGPSVLGLITLTTPIQLLAQIGIILLLFDVGIETDITKLKSSGIKATIVAVGGVVLPFLSGFLLSYYLFHFSILASLFIGSTLTATSIGVTLRVLRDLKKQNSSESQIIIGAAVLDDIIGIILLAILYEFSQSGSIDLFNTAKVLLFIIIFFITAPVAAKCISMTIKIWDEKSDIPGLLPTMIVSLILLFAWTAHKLGAPELLGGFAAGLALSRQFYFPFATFLNETKEFTQKVEKQMKSIIYLFTPIFFVEIGISLNLKSVDFSSLSIWKLTILLFIIAMITKFAAGFFLIKEKLSTKMIVGTSMIPRGEVGLIFANIGLTAGVFKDDIYTSLILVITITTLIAPFALRYIYNRLASP